MKEQKIKFVCPLMTVSDMKKSRDFYETVLEQKVESDFGENISFRWICHSFETSFQNVD